MSLKFSNKDYLFDFRRAYDQSIDNSIAKF